MDDMEKDYTIDTLLELNGEILGQDKGYFVKIEAHRVAVTVDIPHGIRYSLTLHNKYGTRVLGFDNAHAVKPPNKHKYSGSKRLPHDHKHRTQSDKGVPYEFDNAAQLLTDFFAEVDRVINDSN